MGNVKIKIVTARGAYLRLVEERLKIESREARYYTTGKIHVGHTDHLIRLLSFVRHETRLESVSPQRHPRLTAVS